MGEERLNVYIEGLCRRSYGVREGKVGVAVIFFEEDDPRNIIAELGESYETSTEALIKALSITFILLQNVTATHVTIYTFNGNFCRVINDRFPIWLGEKKKSRWKKRTVYDDTYKKLLPDFLILRDFNIKVELKYDNNAGLRRAFGLARQYIKDAGNPSKYAKRNKLP